MNSAPGTSPFASLRRLDPFFMAAVLALMTIGVLFIYSASTRNEELILNTMSRRQILWGLFGIACLLGVVVFDYRRLASPAWMVYGGCLVLLVLVLVMGKKVYGAYRWLNLFGVAIQPSEFAKLGTVLMLASFLGQAGRDNGTFTTVLQTLGLIALPQALILQQPDLGTAITLVPVAVIMMFVGGVRVKHLLILAAIGLALLPLAWLGLGDYQRERLHVFFDPGRDPLGSGWNKIQSEIAVGSGGVSGKGYLQGTQNVLGFLPRTVAPTDFIFSVIAEETGFVGTVMILLLYAVVLWGGLRAAVRSRDRFGRLVAVGVMTLLFFHLFVNMAMTIGLMPVTGIPLPLISYGGSFMVCTLAGLGLVQSVYARRLRR